MKFKDIKEEQPKNGQFVLGKNEDIEEDHDIWYEDYIMMGEYRYHANIQEHRVETQDLYGGRIYPQILKITHWIAIEDLFDKHKKTQNG